MYWFRQDVAVVVLAMISLAANRSVSTASTIIIPSTIIRTASITDLLAGAHRNSPRSRRHSHQRTSPNFLAVTALSTLSPKVNTSSSSAAPDELGRGLWAALIMRSPHRTSAMPPPSHTMPPEEKRPAEVPSSPGSPNALMSLEAVAALGPALGPALLTPDSFDPLRAVEGDDYFWNFIDASFQPLNQGDAAVFRALPPSTLGGAAHDTALALPASDSTTDSAINALPLTQRLVAALLDEGDTPAPAPAPLAAGLSAAALGAVSSGSASLRMRHHEALEARVTHELRAHGLLEPRSDDALVTAMRAAQWRLRELKAANHARQRAVVRSAVNTELRNQPARRELKRRLDTVEMTYLERTLSRLKKNKKSRAKLHKLLQRNFGHYKSADRKAPIINKASPSLSNGGGATPNGAAPTEAPRRSKGKSGANTWRKKKRKSEAGGSGVPAKKHAPGKGGTGTAAGKTG